MEKTVITVVGKDGVGIIAKVCNYLASNNVNILDISQTITGGFFNKMCIRDRHNMDVYLQIYFQLLIHKDSEILHLLVV